MRRRRTCSHVIDGGVPSPFEERLVLSMRPRIYVELTIWVRSWSVMTKNTVIIHAA